MSQYLVTILVATLIVAFIVYQQMRTRSIQLIWLRGQETTMGTREPAR